MSLHRIERCQSLNYAFVYFCSSSISERGDKRKIKIVGQNASRIEINRIEEKRAKKQQRQRNEEGKEKPSIVSSTRDFMAK